MVEIDLKKTKDGQLVLLHDKTIDRTMTGKGAPEDYTLEELKSMYLKNGAGHKTAHKIPTLEEAMRLCKGRILVNIDKGYDYFEDVYEVLKRTGTLKQCIIKSSLPYETVKRENGHVLDEVLFMPVVDLSKDHAEELVDGYLTNLRSRFFELVFAEDNEKTLSMIARLKAEQSKIFINSLWPELCGGHDDDRAVERRETDESWGWIVEKGAALIQTDRPARLIEYLRQEKRHE